jgi:hypothetical protein
MVNRREFLEVTLGAGATLSLTPSTKILGG